MYRHAIDQFGGALERVVRFDSFGWMRERWEREQREAEIARGRNKLLQACATTKFQLGEEVWLEQLGGRIRVQITQVQPPGYVTVPRKYDNRGRWAEPVVCDKAIYQYRRVGSPRTATGQTGEDRLSKVDVQ